MMKSKLFCLLAALVLVAGCESSPKDSGSASGSGAGANTAGYGATPVATAGLQPGSQEELASLDGRGTGDRVFFQYDRSDLTPEARATLDRQAAWLRQYSHVTVTIEGHCDERGTREYNIGLGNRRATAVRNYLIALGINQARVPVLSFGKERPAVVGSGESILAQNRRAVTVVN